MIIIDTSGFNEEQARQIRDWMMQAYNDGVKDGLLEAEAKKTYPYVPYTTPGQTWWQNPGTILCGTNGDTSVKSSFADPFDGKFPS